VELERIKTVGIERGRERGEREAISSMGFIYLASVEAQIGNINNLFRKSPSVMFV
jgi:hypothetical protein